MGRSASELITKKSLARVTLKQLEKKALGTERKMPTFYLWGCQPKQTWLLFVPCEIFPHRYYGLDSLPSTLFRLKDTHQALFDQPLVWSALSCKSLKQLVFYVLYCSSDLPAEVSWKSPGSLFHDFCITNPTFISSVWPRPLCSYLQWTATGTKLTCHILAWLQFHLTPFQSVFVPS